jgi:acylphosphatase
MTPYLMRRARVHISGHVQGVFFRASCADRAERLGLSGWIRNASDGGVQAVFEGDDAGVEEMLAWCRKGPPHARVDRLEVVEEVPTGAEGFRITR